MTISALFRVDTSARVGSGHIMRCRALADFLAQTGWRCRFAVTRESFDTVVARMAMAHEVIVLEDARWDDPTALTDRLGEPCDWLFVDHYGLARDYETACRRAAARIFVLDDLADRPHDCDYLLDYGADEDDAAYAPLTPPGCQLLLGPAFVPLAERFLEMRCGLLPRRIDESVSRILVSFGASDPIDATGRVLETICAAAPEYAVDVVLGPAAPHLQSVRAKAEDAGNVTLHVGIDDMAGLIALTDIAVGAAGVSAWERCCLGLPGVIAATAENQHRTIETIVSAGAALWFVLGEEESGPSLSESLACLLADPTARCDMSRKAGSLCDGRGLYRIGMRIAGNIAAKDGSPVTMRPAKASDSEVMLEWQSDPKTRRYSHDAAAPDRVGHFRWVDAKLADPDCLLNIVEHRGEPAGVLRLDRCRGAGGSLPRWRVSILTAPEKYGNGIGSAALALARRLAPEVQLEAEVLPDNAASHALFRKAGYEWRRDAYYADPEFLPRNLHKGHA